ncbi:MAG: YbaN family protein [Burkholderiales bacterium]|nr:YbaN family protein [Burkholderiales bacterium]OJX09153.1 MAG: hypothetical protein BGO72_19845 [Burkholderiales bacterium 70-64]
MIRRSLAIALWRVVAIVCVAAGVVGMMLPVMPTVPFLLVAAWAAGRGWPRLETWLLGHPVHGESIRRWRDHGAVPRRAKWVASLMMMASALTLALSGAPLWVKVAVPGTMAVVATWLWLRPEV